MPNYLTIVPGLLHAHYPCDGTGALVSLGTVTSLTEVNTVAQNSEGPPPTPTLSRGPLTGTHATGNGFATGIGAGTIWDLRGVADMTLLLWYRFDTLDVTGGQCLVEQWSGTAAQRAFSLAFLGDFQVMGATVNGSVSGVQTYGVTSPVAINVWNFGGLSVRAGDFYIHHNGITRGPLAHGTFAYTSLASIHRVGLALFGGGGISTTGMKGDIGHMTLFKGYGFNAVDWARFYNNGRGRAYPHQYRFGAPGYEHYYAA